MARILVVFQFAATAIILVLMYFTAKQVNFFMEERMGGNDAKIMVVRNLPVQVINKYHVFKNKLLANPLINDVTASFEDPADENMDMMHFETSGVLPEVEEKMLSVYPADDNYFRFYNISFLAGNDFPDYYGVDSLPEHYILNESALAVLGWTPEEAVGKPFKLVFNFQGENLFNGGEIVGVVEDFQPSSMKNEIKPYVYFQKSFWMFSSQVRYDVSRTEEAIEFVKNSWNEIYPGFPFEYTFVEDLYQSVYSNEIRLRNLSVVLAILSVLLAGLGLWALTGVLFQARTKEIGIRRVNGASVIEVFWTLLKEVLFMQIIALFIGLATAWYLVRMWLNNFPYRVDINTGIFFIIAFIILLIALISAGYHAFIIANRNPVESLRYE